MTVVVPVGVLALAAALFYAAAPVRALRSLPFGLACVEDSAPVFEALLAATAAVCAAKFICLRRNRKSSSTLHTYILSREKY